MNVSTNCSGTWGFGYPFPFRSLGTNCDCTIEEASGNDWYSKRSKVTRIISPVFFMIQMTLQLVHEQHWSHLLASWLGQHVATLSWIWVRFQVKSGNFQINIRKLDENHLSIANHPGFMFLIRWIGLICSAFAHGPFVSRLDSYLGAETMVVGQEYKGWRLMVDMVVDTFFTFLSKPWSFEFRSERTRPTFAVCPSFVCLCSCAHVPRLPCHPCGCRW